MADQDVVIRVIFGGKERDLREVFGPDDGLKEFADRVEAQAKLWQSKYEFKGITYSWEVISVREIG